MSYTTCGYRDQDGKDCGQYPTCSRKAGGGSSAGPGKQCYSFCGRPNNQLTRCSNKQFWGNLEIISLDQYLHAIHEINFQVQV